MKKIILIVAILGLTFNSFSQDLLSGARTDWSVIRGTINDNFITIYDSLAVYADTNYVQSQISDSLAAFSGGQWADSTSGIVYADGNVGIGTADPLSALHLNKGTGISNGLTLDSDANSGFSLFGTDAVSGFAGGKEIFRIVENTTEQFIINPQGDLTGTAAAPSLAFGTGSDGIWQSASGVLKIGVASLERLSIDATKLRGSDAVNGWAIRHSETATATNPVFLPNTSNTGDGIGWAGAGQLSLIAGGVEGLRINDAEAHSVAGITDYETLVTNDDDIPNKAYVDSISGGVVFNDSYAGVDVTLNTLFDYMKSYIPDNGDKMVVSGGIGFMPVVTLYNHTVSYAQRINIASINLYTLRLSPTGDIINTTITLTDGSATELDFVSIAW